MDDPLSRGFPFELAQLWQKSSLSDVNVASPYIDVDIDALQFHADDYLDREELQIPDLTVSRQDDEAQDLVPPNTAFICPRTCVESCTATDDGLDIWTLGEALAGQTDHPRLYTWEAFEKKDVPFSDRTAYLSEAGPEVFDAALFRYHRKGADSQFVLPRDVLLRACCNLALARSSVFFKWDLEKRRFRPTLEHVPVSGLSSECYGGFVETLMDFATLCRRLNENAGETRLRANPCPARIAFSRSIASAMDALEETITMSLAGIRSFLQLQNLIQKPLQLVEVLERLLLVVQELTTDESILSRLSDEICKITSVDDAFSNALRQILARTSAPWLEELMRDLSLRTTSTPWRQPLVANETTFDSDIPAQSARSDVASFLNPEDARLIYETRRTVRLLRQYFDGDVDEMLSTSQAMELEASASGITPNCLTLSPLSHPNKPMKRAGAHERVLANEDLPWQSGEAQSSYLVSLDSRMNEVPLTGEERDNDNLRAAALSYCGAERSDSNPTLLNLAEYRDCSPLKSVWPMLETHSRIAKELLLRCLFEKSNLKQHLSLQRDFQLFGNGEFAFRITTSLFSTETQSAERRRGAMPNSETMGLQLIGRGDKRWPPASSELQLSLMGILAETYRPDAKKATSQTERMELPGGLSFSIRELPDKDIEKVMNARSLYALDFLRLSYTAPAPLDAILTPTCMRAYDNIFMHLLRLLRVLHVTTKLKQKYVTRVVNTAGSSKSSQSVSFVLEGHIVTTTLMSHYMDVGIDIPWQSFMNTIDGIDDGVSTRDKRTAKVNEYKFSLHGIRKLHETCLESIKNRLFLRQKQEKIRVALDDVLSAILHAADCAIAPESEPFHAAYVSYREKVKALLDLLQHVVNRLPRSMTAHDETRDADWDTIAVLFARLDWRQYQMAPSTDERRTGTS